jgi:hypothetical protein
MVAVLSPHRTHTSLARYMGALLIWWLSAAFCMYGSITFGLGTSVDWSPDKPRYCATVSGSCTAAEPSTLDDIELSGSRGMVRA